LGIGEVDFSNSSLSQTKFKPTPYLAGLGVESLATGVAQALSLRQAGYTALSQPGAGLLEPVYARELTGYEIVVFYDAGEEQEARNDSLKLLEGGAESVRIVEWPPEAENGADINARLVESPDSFEEWAAERIAASRPVATERPSARIFAMDRVGEPDRYGDVRTWNGKAPADVGRLLSEVVPERVGWLWPGRVPYGKSTLTMDLAARVSAGRTLPNGIPCEPGGVVLLNAEDGLADTIRPRLEAAGADLDRVLALATVPDGPSPGFKRLISLPEDLNALRRAIERVEASLVVVDPLMAFVSGSVNSHKDQDVRRAMAPLAMLAEETGAAILVVRHLNQTTGQNALYRGGGSIGIIGQARSALLVAKDPENEARRVLAALKSNLSKPASSLMFVLAEASNGAVRVEYKGETHHRADALLAAPTDPEECSALDEAMEFLRDELGDGPVWNKQVRKETRKAEISEATLRRAKTALGVRSVKEADGSWSWSLPEKDQGVQPEHHEAQALRDEQLEHLESLPIDKPNPSGRSEKQGAHGEHLKKRSESGSDKPSFRHGRRQGAQVSGDERLASDDLAAFLANPPEWWRVEAEKCLSDPEQYLRPLSSATAFEIYGSTNMMARILPEIRKALRLAQM
jgi:AAA domain